MGITWYMHIHIYKLICKFVIFQKIFSYIFIRFFLAIYIILQSSILELMKLVTYKLDEYIILFIKYFY